MVALLFARELRDSSVNDSVIDIVNRGVGHFSSANRPTVTRNPRRPNLRVRPKGWIQKSHRRYHAGVATSTWKNILFSPRLPSALYWQHMEQNSTRCKCRNLESGYAQTGA
uniref:Uncharacterized protein n=1 Tax=Cacopsylla melanoneura TaxID=428564 RepID=A0A8D8YP33_9HEMI